MKNTNQASQTNTAQHNAKRRKLLQGIAGVGAVSATGFGLSSAAMALSSEQSAVGVASSASGSALPCCDLTIYQQQSGTSERVTLINNTGKAVTIDEVSPIGLSHSQGSLSVKVKVPNGSVTMPAGGRLTFEISASTANTGWNISEQAIPNVIAGQLVVKSHHPAFNGVIPVIAFDAVPV